MKKLIIFGIGDQAEMAYYYFKNDSNYEVAAFTVDKQFLIRETLFNLPVVDFETINKKYLKDDYYIFIAIGYSKLNKLRAEKYMICKEMGYRMASYISSKASVFTEDIGENAFILEDNTIQPYVKIGNNVTLWSGNHIGHHSIIKDNCFITSHVVVAGRVSVGENSFIGINSTIRDNIKIGKENVIGAGSLILNDTDDFSVYSSKASEKSKVPSNRLRGI